MERDNDVGRVEDCRVLGFTRRNGKICSAQYRDHYVRVVLLVRGASDRLKTLPEPEGKDAPDPCPTD